MLPAIIKLMYPNQQLPTPNQAPPPATYLDQIAPQQAVNTIKPWQLWSFIGGILLLVIIFVVALMNTGGPSVSTQLSNFVYRVNALNDIASNNENNVQNSQLVADNAQMESLLTSISQQSSDALASSGIKKLPETPKNSPITAEFSKLSSELDDARLNAVFDRTYAREVAYQLSTLRAEIATMLTRTNSESVKSYLQTADDNLKPLEKEFSNFTDTIN